MIGVAGYRIHRAVEVVIGVDTHKDQHVAVAIDGRGVRLGEWHVPATTTGYEELERWSHSLGDVGAFGIEGTGSYGAGVARFMTGRGHTVVEVNRPDRSVRHRKGKSDPIDAEMAARAVLAGVADVTPKSGEGEVEMIRMLKSARDSGVKGSDAGCQPDEGTGRHSSGRTSRIARWSDHHCPRQTMQKLPPRSPGRSQDGCQVRTPFACHTLPSAR